MTTAPDPRMFDVTLWQGHYPANHTKYALVLDFNSRLGRAQAKYELDSLLVSVVGLHDRDADPAGYQLKVTSRDGTVREFVWLLR